MYKDYYHLQSDPFTTHPNTDTFFVSETHKEAWYYLLFGIDTREPFLLLTGEYGMGKTLLCLRLIKVLKEKGLPRVLYIPTCNEGYGGILRRIAASLGITATPEDEEILQDMIYDRFRGDTEKSLFYLIIDDAHELDTSILTKLKYLSTFNHNEFFPVIMIFVGHPSFLHDLRTPALSSLNQRIKRRCHLARFSLEDTKNYIYFRLMKSGATGIPAFSDESIQKIYEYSGGVPRLINNVCDTCLLIGASKQLISIPPAVVDLAQNLVEGSLTGAKTETGIEPVLHAVGPAAPAEAAAKSVEKAVAAFSEDLPAGPAVQQAPVASAASAEEYQPDPNPPRKSILDGSVKKIVTWGVAVVLLILAASTVYNLAVKDSGILNIFSQGSSTPSQSPAVQPAKEATAPPASVPLAGVPTLRDEMAEKPPAQAQAPAGPAAEPPPPPNTGYSKQGAAVEAPLPPKGESAAAAAGEAFPALPFSLRGSGYQQEERAFPEMSEIRHLGLTPYLVKTDLGDLGTLWRIYIGFYSTEEEAKKIKATYKLADATVQRTDYACQVAEFSNETEGLSIMEKLKKSGYFPYAIQKGRNLFRIYLGAYEKKSEAEALQQRLQKSGVKCQVVKR